MEEKSAREEAKRKEKEKVKRHQALVDCAAVWSFDPQLFHCVVAVDVVSRCEAESKVCILEPIKRRKPNVDVAEDVFDPTSENVVERRLKMTGGEAVDVVLNCAGVERAMKDGMNAVEFRVWSVH
jgi:hypothetical protein